MNELTRLKKTLFWTQILIMASMVAAVISLFASLPNMMNFEFILFLVFMSVAGAAWSISIKANTKFKSIALNVIAEYQNQELNNPFPESLAGVIGKLYEQREIDSLDSHALAKSMEECVDASILDKVVENLISKSKAQQLHVNNIFKQKPNS